MSGLTVCGGDNRIPAVTNIVKEEDEVSVSLHKPFSFCFTVCSHCPTPTSIPNRQIATELSGIVVLVQCEHLNTILCNPFFVGVCIGVSVGQCERTITSVEYIH